MFTKLRGLAAGDDEEYYGLLLVFGSAITAFALRGSWEALHEPSVVLPFIGWGFLPALAALALGWWMVFRRSHGGPIRLAIAGFANLALVGFGISHHALNGRLLGAATFVGIALIARFVTLSWRAHHGRSGGRHEAVRFWLILALVVAVAGLNDLSAAIRLAVLAYAIQRVWPVLEGFEPGIMAYLDRLAALFGQREPVVEPEPEPELPHADWTAEDRERAAIIERFVARNWPKEAETSTITGVMNAPTYRAYVLAYDLAFSSAKLIARAADLATALGLQNENKINIVSGRGGLHIQVLKPTVDIVWYEKLVAESEGLLRGKRSHCIAGVNEFYEPVVMDLLRPGLPNLVIAGGSGSGKSTAANAILGQLVTRYSPREFQLVMIDPKRTLGMIYRNNAIPHVTDILAGRQEVDAGFPALIEALSVENDRRTSVFGEVGVTDLSSYNRRCPKDPMGFLVIFIDELGDINNVAPDDVKAAWQRWGYDLATKCRSQGIVIAGAVQRPVIEDIGKFREQLRQKLVLKVEGASSELILPKGWTSARLAGRGDCYHVVDDGVTRIQTPFLPESFEKLLEAVPDAIEEDAVTLPTVLRAAAAKWASFERTPSFTCGQEGPLAAGRPSAAKSTAGAPAAGPAAAPKDAGWLAREAVKAAHSPAITDRDWLVLQGMALAFANETDPYAEMSWTGTGLAPFVERAIPAGYGTTNYDANAIEASLKTLTGQAASPLTKSWRTNKGWTDATVLAFASLGAPLGDLSAAEADALAAKQASEAVALRLRNEAAKSI